MLLDVDGVADRNEQHEHDCERGLELWLDSEPLLRVLHVLGCVEHRNERRHDDQPPEEHRHQRTRRADRLVALIEPELVVDLPVPVQEVDPQRDHGEPEYTERIALQIALTSDRDDFGHRDQSVSLGSSGRSGGVDDPLCPRRSRIAVCASFTVAATASPIAPTASRRSRFACSSRSVSPNAVNARFSWSPSSRAASSSLRCDSCGVSVAPASLYWSASRRPHDENRSPTLVQASFAESAIGSTSRFSLQPRSRRGPKPHHGDGERRHRTTTSGLRSAGQNASTRARSRGLRFVPTPRQTGWRHAARASGAAWWNGSRSSSVSVPPESFSALPR